MRLKITFSAYKEYVKLPIHYNKIVQSMLYKSLPEELSNFLHNLGFYYNNRPFKLFTFSRIFSEKFYIDKSSKIGFKNTASISYKSPIHLYISSSVNYIVENWGQFLIKKSDVRLYKNIVYIESMESVSFEAFKEEMTVRTLSPITVYRTFENGRKYYRYYAPIEKEFEELIKENLRKKYHIITGKDIKEFPISISPINTKKVLLKYENFPIEAYDGTFKIKTDPEMFKVIYDAGFGAKNSQGFGMIEVIE
ncbi:MAG: CRISPR-associated endoribonuclease Cas6 [Hydrogenobaculum sp.]